MFYTRTIDRPRQGVNIYGYAFAEHGVGQLMRRFVEVAREAEMPYAVLPYVETYSRQQAVFADFGVGESVFDINLICVNADTIPRFVEHVGSELLEGRYNIGVWAWEVEDLPESMAQAARFLDEIWGISSFTAEAIARSVSCPVLPCPLPVPMPPKRPASRTRAELGLSEDFLFFFAFDFNSILSRKNPLAVVKAFTQAFSPTDPAKLVIKTINGSSFQEQMLRLNTAAVDHPGVLIVDGYLPAAEQDALMLACDAYVSLHRSEGFGFTLAEAMAFGKPVIGTAYSGNLDFMSEANSYLVPYRLVEVGPDAPPYPASSRWADPDIDEAARLMRRVFEHPEEAREKGERARHDIQSRHTPAARAQFLAERLATIREELTQQQPANGPLKILGFDEGRAGTRDPRAEEITDMDAAAFVRAHREFDSVAELIANRLRDFDPDKVDPERICGGLDGVRTDDDTVTIWGWARDPRPDSHVRAVVLLIDGKQLPVEIQIGAERADLAAVDPALANSGWHVAIPRDQLPGEPGSIEAYALLTNSVYGPLPPAPPAAVQPEAPPTGSMHELLERLAAARAELERTHNERQAARQTLDQLLASRSWRLTAPLRSLFRVLGRG